ncbi:TrbI/VirB10 family protein [Vibrio algivorus]|uniref:Conjugal transfer protein n=1 Tax=Vibrio algivorus TaxID=1667024 RepID=A0A557PH02_9VIBR|nr:TrbI/VirB10 family protein [Vibrio algivorus]TVO39931.1 hypothetical protein FOF44_00235 [Vibrio algivorus]
MSEERTPQEKKKLLVYLIGSAGSVALLLFLMMVRDIVTRPDNAQKRASQERTQHTHKKVQSPEDFEAIASKQTPASTNQYYQEGMNDDTPPPTLSEEALAVKKAELKYRLAEIDRSLASTKSHWLKRQSAVKTAAVSSPVTSETQSAIDTLEKQRTETEKRIEQVRRLKAELDKNGGYNASSEQIKKIQSEFSPPPPDITGFTRSNQYNADIEGKIKLPIGTVIPVLTTTKTISDYTGIFKGMVTQDIYDVSYQYVLIPKGAEVIMKSMNISNVNEPIQARMGIVVQWVILPDGNKIDMSKSSGLDREGVGAIKDKVNYHAMSQLLGVAAYALLSSNTSYEGSGSDNDNSYKGDVGEGLRTHQKQKNQPVISWFLKKRLKVVLSNIDMLKAFD